MEKNDSYGLGVASILLGILSIVTFCSCCNVIFSILAILFGCIQIFTKSNKDGSAFAWIGIATSIASVIMTIVFWAICFMPDSYFVKSTTDPEEFYEQYMEFFEQYYPQEYDTRFPQNFPQQNAPGRNDNTL